MRGDSRGRWRRLAATLLAAAIAALAFWLLTAPAPLTSAALAPHDLNLKNGEQLFHAGACLGCHKAPETGPGAGRGLPSGGAPLVTPVGVFYPQNLTPDVATGLGLWRPIDFVNAMRRGLSPQGTHYFPAFPYVSYRSMSVEDLLDLHAWLQTLPAVHAPSRPASVPFAPLARRAVGLWNRLAFRRPAYVPEATRAADWKRGAYLVNAVGHCGECHTPKDWLMLADERRHMAGGPHPAGEGKVPGLRGLTRRHRYEDAEDLTLALQNGIALGYEDLSSGGMEAIQESLARLPASEVRAMAEYLVSLD